MLPDVYTSSFSWCRGTLCSLEGFWKMCATGRASRRPWFVRSCTSTRHLVSTDTDEKGIPHEAVHGQGTSEPGSWLRCQCCTDNAHSAPTSTDLINPGTSFIKTLDQNITSRAAGLRCIIDKIKTYRGSASIQSMQIAYLLGQLDGTNLCIDTVVNEAALLLPLYIVLTRKCCEAPTASMQMYAYQSSQSRAQYCKSVFTGTEALMRASAGQAAMQSSLSKIASTLSKYIDALDTCELGGCAQITHRHVEAVVLHADGLPVPAVHNFLASSKFELSTPECLM